MTLIRCVLGLLAVQLAAGCSGGGPVAAPVEPETARQTLKRVLDTWKEGGTPDSLRSASPSVVVQDIDWQSGNQLVGYKLLGEGSARDANLHVPVELTLRDKSGKEFQKKAFYVVGTDPVLTVFRELPL